MNKTILKILLFLTLFFTAVLGDKDYKDRCWVTQVATNAQFASKWECVQETTSGGSCFPSNSKVLLSNGTIIPMNQLKLFDKVMTLDDNNNYLKEDTVIAFLHQNEQKQIAYVNLQFDKEIIKISPDHVIFIQKKNQQEIIPILAKNVEKNDKIYSALHNQWIPINNIQLSIESGIYSPLTLSGKLIIDNALVSCYANFPKQDIAHLAFRPYRILYYLIPNIFFGALFQSQDESTLHWYAKMLMDMSKSMGPELNYIDQSE